MERINLEGAENFIGKSYLEIGEELLNSRKNIFKKILNNRAVPDEGLDELTIEYILNTLASMDSNNGINHIGIGEREGRIYSNIVKKRNFNLVHGMGRSGNVNEIQPKAVGSSLLVQLTCSLVKNILHSIGLNFIKDLIVFPSATGMAITISLSTLKKEKETAKFVLWPRIDQKTCFKSILTANLTPIVIEPLIDSQYELSTNIDEIERQILVIGCENVLCVFSTTSCFAPRAYDKIIEISKLCKKYKIFHLINNAYGIYCGKIIDMLNQSVKAGNVDIIVSSTDKNFMVPVGGALIYSPNSEMIEKIKNNYPGRASLSSVIDLFITLLEMGKNKFRFLIQDRKKKFIVLKDAMTKLSQDYNEKILENKNNKISICMSLVNICKNATEKKDITYLGSLFYKRQISGIKIIAPSLSMKWNGYNFNNYGSHCQDFPILPYCAFACAIGITEEEIIGFQKKFRELIKDYQNYIENKVLKIPKNIDDKHTMEKTKKENINSKNKNKEGNIFDKTKGDIETIKNEFKIEQVEIFTYNNSNQK